MLRRHGNCFARNRIKKMSEIGFWRGKSILRQILYNISFFRKEKKLRENFHLSHSLWDTPSKHQIRNQNVFMNPNNLKIFTNAYFSLFVILSYDLAANSLSRKKNWAIFSGENIKIVDLWVLFCKNEKKIKICGFWKISTFLVNFTHFLDFHV